MGRWVPKNGVLGAKIGGFGHKMGFGPLKLELSHIIFWDLVPEMGFGPLKMRI